MENTIARLVFLVIAIAAAAYSAQGPQPVPPSVDEYRAAIERVLGSSPRQSLEPIFALGNTAAKAVLKMPSYEPGTVSPLESFDQKTFNLVAQEMKGFVVNREETVFVQPDTNFWVTLAESKGQNADQQFFQLLKKTYPDSVWPAYVRQQTDYSGCTDFGTKGLTHSFVDWSAFQKAFPSAYADAAKHELEAVSQHLGSTCACGDKASVISELEYFLQKIPKGNMAEKVRTRLDNIRKDKPEVIYGKPTKMRYKCISG